MFSDINEIADTLGINILDAITEPARPEKHGPLPDAIAHGPAAPFIDKLVGGGGTLWSHQSIALDHICAGENVAIATGTASGKTEIFQIAALHRILENPDSRILVFYPTKALVNDQLGRWKNAVATCGRPQESAAEIHGSVPMPEREDNLAKARIILMTPDVCQAWMMRRVGSDFVQKFLRNLALVVLDEAHVYESVFGSNQAFLLRRLIAAKFRIAGKAHSSLQFIAATATLSAPEEHLQKLTGKEFVGISEKNNGSPHYERHILHVDPITKDGSADEDAVCSIMEKILNLPKSVQCIAFRDSRQGVERIIHVLDNESCLPYRGGYKPEDRIAIEEALRQNKLRGVVSTSALELGIDIPDMRIGMTFNVPQSRKVLRQRVGRIGRRNTGIFMIIAPPNAFKQLGVTFQEYYQGEVESSHLYLDNRFVQFTHARCLWDEVEVTPRGRDGLAPREIWPEGFSRIADYAKKGGSRPKEYDEVAQRGGNAPHFNYAMRSIGETSFKIDKGKRDFSQQIGDIALQQAIREAYPGAIYLHAGRTYKVLEWANRAGPWSAPAIRVENANSDFLTKPILRKIVNTGTQEEDIVEGKLHTNGSGFLAEVHVQITQSVEGFKLGQKKYEYKELRRENPNMSTQSRDFRTTGVMLRIEEGWFSGSKNDSSAPRIRESVAEALKKLLTEKMSIDPHDIEAVHTNISLNTDMGRNPITDAVVIYDSVNGGLRLTEPLFDKFHDYIEQLQRAAKLAGDDALVGKEVVEQLAKWAQNLAPAGVEELAVPQTEAPEGWLRVYKPGSVVFARGRGNVRKQYTLKEPLFQGNELCYQYEADAHVNKADPSVKLCIPARLITAEQDDDWSWAFWNPKTDEIRDIDAFQK